MLKIAHLTKSYGSKKAVDDLSLHIQKGEIYGFIGPNGAGKTTTIKSCAGILQYYAGDIVINGMNLQDKQLECKQIMAYLPDNPDLYEFYTGIKYVEFIADIYGIKGDVRHSNIEKYADMFGMTDDMGQLISAYSHGMKQKLALISALIHEPGLLLLDEPFTGLDPKAAHLLKQVMRDICDRGGAIFFSTHVLEVAEKLCDKVAIIRNGKLVVAGAMADVLGDESLEEVFLELEGKDD